VLTGPLKFISTEVPNVAMGFFPYTFIPGFLSPARCHASRARHPCHCGPAPGYAIACIGHLRVDELREWLLRSGFRGPLGWYCNVDRSRELLAPFAGAAVTVPGLYIAGDRDFAATVNSQFIAKLSATVPKLRPAIMLPGCGHWTEQNLRRRSALP
jgi:hypothetical protein